jgi:hypothetical protein
MMAINVVHADIHIWDGGGSGNNWATANNWNPNTAPIANDSLVFAGTTRLTPNNNFAAGTAFSNITFNSGAGAFTLVGNALDLNGSIAYSAHQNGPTSAQLNGATCRMNFRSQAGLLGNENKPLTTRYACSCA